jgi:hypothetical protein
MSKCLSGFISLTCIAAECTIALFPSTFLHSSVMIYRHGVSYRFTSGIVGIVGFRLQLATTLQTHIEAVLEAAEMLRDITFEVASTASALKQLQDITDDDKRDVNEQNIPDDGRKGHKCPRMKVARRSRLWQCSAGKYTL